MECPTCSTSYPDSEDQCPNCGVRLSLKSPGEAASSATFVEMENQTLDRDDMDSWWDLAPGAEKLRSEDDEFQGREVPIDEISAEGPGGNSLDESHEEQLKHATITFSPSDSLGASPNDDDGWSQLLAKATMGAGSTPPAPSSPPSPASPDSVKPSERDTIGAGVHPISLGEPLKLRDVKKPSHELVDTEKPKEPEPSVARPPATPVNLSAAVEEPLHDSWSASSSEESPPPKASSTPVNLSAAVEEPLHDSWSASMSEEAVPAPSSEPTRSHWTPEAEPEEAEPKRFPGFPSNPEEGWSRQPAEVTRPAEPGGSPPSESSSPARALPVLGVVVGLLIVVGLGYGSYRLAQAWSAGAISPSAASTASPAELKSDSEIWLASAQESLQAQRFKLAAVQLEKAAGFLKKEGGQEELLRDTRLKRARTLARAGQHLEAAEAWREIGRTYPGMSQDVGQGVQQNLRQLRVQANKQIQRAEAAIKAGQPEQADSLARSALKLYREGQGSNAQRARAHGVLGDAFRLDGNDRAAVYHFSEAHKLDKGGRYAKELRKIGPVGRPKVKKPIRLAKPPSFIPKSNVPQGR